MAYVFAVAATSAMLWLRLAMGFKEGDPPVLILLLVPIAWSAYMGGMGPGLLATAIAAVAASYFLSAPDHSFAMKDLYSFHLLIFIGVGIFTTVLLRSLKASVSHLKVVIADAGDLRSALDQHANVAITDPQGKITFVNDKFCALLKFSREELVGKDFRIISSGHHSPAFMHELWKTISDGKIWHGEFKNKAKDGAFFWADMTIVPYLDERGKPWQYFAISADITERKLAEEQIVRLASFPELNPNPIVEADLVDGVIHYANPAALRHYPDLEKRRLEHPLLVGLIEVAGDLLKGKTNEVRREVTDGKFFYSQTITFVSENQRLRVYSNDITERKQVEESLRESKARIQLAAEATNVGIWEWHLPTNRVLWDAQMFRFYGMAPTDDGFVEYSKWRDAVFPEDLAEQEGKLQAAVRQLGRGSREFRIRRVSDGESRYIEAFDTVRLNGAGEAEWVVGTNLDITERKLAETKSRESEESFRTMANSMSQLAWIAKPDGFIFWYNQRWYDYTGTTPKEMEGWGWQHVHDPQVLPRVMEEWGAAIAAGEPFDMEFPLRRADGTFRMFLTRAQPLKDAEGRVMQWFGTNTDVEALKRAELEIQKLNNDLEQRVTERTAQLEAVNKELEAFSYSVSHDLRAPLRGVSGYVSMIKEDYGTKLDAEGNRMLGVVNSEAMRMGRLIDDLLAFSRMGRQKIGNAMIDMNRLASQEFDSLTRATPEATPRFVLKPLPSASGDSAMLRQVFANLLGNAIKYSRNQTHPVVEVGSLSDEAGITYYVKDNGSGFDEKYSHKLFGVFQRLHSEEEFEGTGVGLALVQRVIHRHGGKVWAKGKPNEGATFFFTLPTPNHT